MTNRRITRELTPEEKARLEHQRELIAKELPDLIQRDKWRKEAAEEQTFSGAFRRAIHSSGISITRIAEQSGITLVMLDEFLTGERTLRSDVMDRLAATLSLEAKQATK